MAQMQLSFNQYYDVKVTELVTADQLFITIPSHPMFYKHLTMLEQSMTSSYNNHLPMRHPYKYLPSDVKGLVCAANYNGKWQRVVIVEVLKNSEDVIIRLVDHGGLIQVNKNSLYTLKMEFASAELPFQAIECHLAYIKPPGYGTHYSPQARAYLESEILNQEVIACLVTKCCGKFFINLFKCKAFPDGSFLRVSINRELVALGLAELLPQPCRHFPPL